MSKEKIYMADFETTVYEGQTYTEVWAAASVELYTEDVNIFHSIDELFDYYFSIPGNKCVYFHNLKFDGHFILYYIINTMQLHEASILKSGSDIDVTFVKKKDMPDDTFTYTISDTGQWYRIVIKHKKQYIEIRDSLKLLPFSVKEIGNSFATKHKKLDMEYTGYRYAGCNITDEEKEYISNDVLVVKEALEIMFNQGHKRLTIGSCCLAEYKAIIYKDDFNLFFPRLDEISIDKNIYGSETADEYVRKSYRGGWCYLVKGKENKIYNNGITADVNSLYPSMMHSESGNWYPVNKPHFWSGNFIPDQATFPERYYFIRIKTRFYIKENKLPFIQIKGSYFYKSTEMLETSDYLDNKTGIYYKYFKGFDDELIPTTVTMTLTCTDFILLKEHYDLEDFEILDGCWFYAEKGIFDEYIDKWKKIKLESTGAIRTIAKLFSNNLYGKLATNPISSYKIARKEDDELLHFYTVLAKDKQPVYIPAGSAITSYARNFTIRAAQKNYHGKDKPGFIYADTDSIHCDLPADKIKGITVHPKNYCCWKLESSWDKAIFVRQKTYIEHVTHKDLEPIDKPYYDIKCAGMPDTCKNLLRVSMGDMKPEDIPHMTPEKEEFIKTKRTMLDFKKGLVVPGKLMPKKIKGGVVLAETEYMIRY